MRRILAFILLMILIMVQSAMPVENEMKKYEDSYNKWKSSGITHYRIKVEYSAFSPISGTWELEVQNGELVHYSFNGRSEKKFLDAANGFTVEAIYKKALPATCTDCSSRMIIKTEYDDNTGFISSVKRIKNPEFPGRIRKDTGFAIRIIELIPLKSGGAN